MRMRKSHANAATAVATVLGMALFLPGCATTTQALTPSADQTSPSSEEASNPMRAIPPGQRLERFTLCYELRRPRASPLEAPVKHFSIDVSILVPQDDCLALNSEGWLRAVPGRCSRPALQNTCKP